MSGLRRQMVNRSRALVSAAVVALLGSLAPLSAQSLSTGALTGVVTARDGVPLGGAAVTVTPVGAGAGRDLETRDDGSFAVRMIAPGVYSVLVEAIGYQPVRLRGVVVAAGRTTNVVAALERRPPPITSVTEIDYPGTIAGPIGRVLTGSDLNRFDARRELTDISRGISEVAQPLDGRSGFALAAGGLPGRHSALFVDALPELMLRHPGLPGEQASAPLFGRDGINQAQILGSTPDGEWRGVAGSVLSASTNSGTNRVQFSPFATYSGAKIGGNSRQNPGDSTATSFQVGATLSAALKRDTAHVFLQADYQSLEAPTPFPWESDSTRYGGQLVSLRETLPLIGADSFSTALNGAVAPVVRSWKGGSGLGRLDWRIGSKSSLMIRAGGASWKETEPYLGIEVGNSNGSSLKARDISMGVSLSTIGVRFANEFRAGFASARRDWLGGSLPTTSLVAEGVRFGGNPALPGRFESSILSFSDAIQYNSGRHLVKGGVSVDRRSLDADYSYGAGGIFHFGDLDHFGAAAGTYFSTESTAPAVKVSSTEVGLFLQDSWSVTPTLNLLFGLRYSTEFLPKNLPARHADWLSLTGQGIDTLIKDRKGIQPRLGFVLSPGGGNWVIQGGLGLYSTGIDLAAFSEAANFAGNVRVNRGSGSFTGWPAAPASSLAPDVGTRLTLISVGQKYRAPRSLKGQVGVTGSISGGVSVQLAGTYQHSDFLFRRVDLNRSSASSGETQEGRPVYGKLVQSGGLVTVVPSSSRRFGTYDLVTGLAPTGFSDHYELTAAVGRQVSRSVSFLASYTYSRTRDNLVGALAADPADQLSPFPEGVNGADWDESRSDLDITHRVSATAEIQSGGTYPVTLAARARWRSGLPFTPGFRPGVDVNGDLAGNNDPATSDAVVSPTGAGALATCDGGTTGTFAARNSCRERGVGSIDLRLSVALPFGATGSRLAFTVDAFNVVATSTGLVDRAALLIDPSGSLTTAASGGVTLPLIANSRFGTLLSRRGEPRLLRFGLRLEY